MTARPWWLWGFGVVGVAIVALLAVIAYALLTGDGDGSEAEVAGIAQGATLTPTATPEPTPCPQCPGPTPCPEETPCPACPEPITCPACICPEPIVCPQCPDPSAVLSAHLESERCTTHTLGVELGEIIGGDTATPQQFLNQHCQGVVLLEGSLLAYACFATGMEAARFTEPGEEAKAVQAWVLGERYCRP